MGSKSYCIVRFGSVHQSDSSVLAACNFQWKTFSSGPYLSSVHAGAHGTATLNPTNASVGLPRGGSCSPTALFRWVDRGGDDPVGPEAATCGSDYVDSERLINTGVGTGTCIAPAIFDPDIEIVSDVTARTRTEMQMMVLVGGIYPLQRRFRWSSATAALGPGGKDYAQAGRIADLLEDRLLAFRTAERGARALVRSDTGWRFISILAERLIDRGVVRGTSVFGRAPVSTADWFCHWPPTLEQLRTGWLPCH